jgi:four helix bundle protein
MESKDLILRLNVFAHECVRFANCLPGNNLSNWIRNQLFRCSTSAASNYRAVCLAQSKASFIAKLSIVIEEIDESAFWLEFSLDERLSEDEKGKVLLREAKELTSIFVKSRKTAKENEKLKK